MTLNETGHGEAERTEGSRFECSHSVDLDGPFERTTLDRGRDLLDLDAEDVAEHAHHRSPHHHERHVLEHLRHPVHRSAETDHVAHDIGLVVQRVIEDFLNPYLGYPGADTADQSGEDVERPAGIDTRHEHRRRPGVTRRLDHAHQFLRGTRGMEKRIEGCGDDVSTRTQEALEVHVRLHRSGIGRSRINDDVDIIGERDLDIVCRQHPEISDVRKCAGILADLVRVRHDDPNQFEIAMRIDCTDRRSANISRPPHHHTKSHAVTLVPDFHVGSGETTGGFRVPRPRTSNSSGVVRRARCRRARHPAPSPTPRRAWNRQQHPRLPAAGPRRRNRTDR